jgi:single-strand DNA-binding protein
MTEAAVSFAGNLTDQPEVRYTQDGIARAMLRVAVSGRREQQASVFTVIAWRDQAEHAAESLRRGSRVAVVGRLQQRSWTAEDGSAHSTVKVLAEELGRASAGRRQPRRGREARREPGSAEASRTRPVEQSRCPLAGGVGPSRRWDLWCTWRYAWSSRTWARSRAARGLGSRSGADPAVGAD